jgi:hypothetical protein
VTDDIHSPTNAGPAEIGEPPASGHATTEFVAADGGYDESSAGGAPSPDATALGEGPARPELLVAGAFAGGLVTAMILRRFGG